MIVFYPKIKFLHLIGAEIFGAILSLVGIYMFFRRITGKSDLVVEGKGVKAMPTNSALGTIIRLIGVALIVFSLDSSSVTREESGLSSEHILETWTANSYKVTEAMDVEQVIKQIVPALLVQGFRSVLKLSILRALHSASVVRGIAQLTIESKEFMGLGTVAGKGDDYNIVRIAAGELLEPSLDGGNCCLVIRHQGSLAAKCVGEKRMQRPRIARGTAQPVDSGGIVSINTNEHPFECHALSLVRLISPQWAWRPSGTSLAPQSHDPKLDQRQGPSHHLNSHCDGPQSP